MVSMKNENRDKPAAGLAAWRRRRDIEWLADGLARNVVLARIAAEDGISSNKAEAQLLDAEETLAVSVAQNPAATRAVIILQLSRIITENLTKAPQAALKAIAERNKLLGLYAPSQVEQVSEVTIRTVSEDKSL